MEYGKLLYSCLVLCFFLRSFSYFSSDLSGRRLDVCHTSTHGVALVRMKNVGLKRAACGLWEISGAKSLTAVAVVAQLVKVNK